MKTERELFEAWAYSKKWNIFRVRDMGIDRYVDDFVDGAWNGWQASAQREGYKLVPVRCTNNMAHAAKEVDGRLSAFKYGDVWEAMIAVAE